MNQSIQSETPTLTTEQLTIDLARGAIFAKITQAFLNTFPVDQLRQLGEQNPVYGRLAGAILDSKRDLEQYRVAVKAITKDQFVNCYLTNNLKPAKIFDLVALLETATRIGLEEHPEVYEEFLSMCTELITAVFQSQVACRKLFFPKYRAFMALITEELRRDTNRETPNFIYQQGHLFLGTGEAPKPVNNETNVDTEPDHTSLQED